MRVKWYSKAAEQGDPFAQQSVASMFMYGEGVKPDKVSAYMWFSLSKANGGPNDPLLGALVPLMTAQEIAEAKRRANKWRPKGIIPEPPQEQEMSRKK